MRQNSEETAANMISMEEYLQKRQAITGSEDECNSQYTSEIPSAWKLAELLYV